VNLDTTLGLLTLNQHTDRPVRRGIPLLKDHRFEAPSLELPVSHKKINDRTAAVGDARGPLRGNHRAGDIHTPHHLPDLLDTRVPVTSPNKGLAAPSGDLRHGSPQGGLGTPSALDIPVHAHDLDVTAPVGMQVDADRPVRVNDLGVSDIEVTPPCNSHSPGPRVFAFPGDQSRCNLALEAGCEELGFEALDRALPRPSGVKCNLGLLQQENVDLGTMVLNEPEADPLELAFRVTTLRSDLTGPSPG
jgi:hypothetical protein